MTIYRSKLRLFLSLPVLTRPVSEVTRPGEAGEASVDTMKWINQGLKRLLEMLNLDLNAQSWIMASNNFNSLIMKDVNARNYFEQNKIDTKILLAFLH